MRYHDRCHLSFDDLTTPLGCKKQLSSFHSRGRNNNSELTTVIVECQSYVVRGHSCHVVVVQPRDSWGKSDSGGDTDGVNNENQRVVLQRP